MWSTFIQNIAEKVAETLDIEIMDHDFYVIMDITKGTIHSHDNTSINYQTWNFTEECMFLSYE